MTDAERLMRFLAGSLVSWLTFQQAAGREKMSTEHFMYPPIFEVASGRRWKIRPQFPISYGGTVKHVDFVMYKNNEVVAIEISYIRANSKKDKIINDERKLRQFKINEFCKTEGVCDGKSRKMKRFIMIAGRVNHLKKYCYSFRQEAATSCLREAKELLKKNEHIKRKAWIYRSPFEWRADHGRGQLSHWCVMVLSVSNSVHNGHSTNFSVQGADSRHRIRG